MITLEHREQIRRAYFVDNQSIREIARSFGHARKTIRQALRSAEQPTYTLKIPRPAPVLDPFKKRIDALLKESKRLPRKQRYTAEKIYQLIQREGYRGSASTVRGYVARWRQQHNRPELFLPLEFDPGADAQADWGEATVIMAGQRRIVDLFVMRLCYSRRLFVMAFPSQKQESLFEGHRQAFHHFQGVPHRISYDNMSTAVDKILKGRGRKEQRDFVAFRSHYLFESRFCTPGEGHEKGGVEHGVGFARRNFMVPLPEVDSFDALNGHLIEQCRADDARLVKGQKLTIGEAWHQEQPHLRPLPERDFDCCKEVPATLSPYSQVTFETNRYSVPTDRARRQLVLKAYPFHIEILHLDQVLARHARCYEKELDIIDPLHYLPLIAQRPGAFEHAKPVRRWRERWPRVYEDLLERLRERWPEGRGIREFVTILGLHREHPASVIEAAVTEALHYGCIHADGVKLCLHQLIHPEQSLPSLAFDSDGEPLWALLGAQAPDLFAYNQLLGGA